MPVREIKAAGLQALELATALLQRARRADPEAGLWEAADVQWAWRRPRPSDAVEKLFWLDAEGPVAGVLLTRWSEEAWQCDPVIVPGAAGPEPERVWQRAMEHASRHAAQGFDLPVSDDDPVFAPLALQAGLRAGEQDCTAWMDAADWPPLAGPAQGFIIVDRSQRSGAPHPLQARNGQGVAERLSQCSLYDPTLDLAVETTAGQVAGYSLYWFDPATKVGLVEPVRVEDRFQRLGLARAMLAAGIARLASKGAERIKICYQSAAAAALYQGLGFRQTSTATWYQVRPNQPGWL